MPIVPPSYGQRGGGTGPGGLSRDQVLSLIRGNATEFTFGNAFPSSPLVGALHYITVDNVTIAAKNTDSDAITEGFNGNLFRFDGGDWRFIYNFRSLIEVLIQLYSVYAGEYATNTAYAKNRIVTSGSDIFWTVAAVADTNTTAPASNASFVQLNGGGTSSSGITAQQFLDAMPNDLRVIEAFLEEGFIDTANVRGTYNGYIRLFPNAFSDATQVRVLLNGETSSPVAYDPSSDTVVEIPLTLTTQQQTELIADIRFSNKVEVEFRFLDDANNTVFSYPTYVPKVTFVDGDSDSPVFAARAEQVFFDALTNVSSTEQNAVLRTVTPIFVRQGSGSPVILATVSGQTGQIQIRKAGAYHVHLDGIFDIAQGSGALHATPRVRLFNGTTRVSEIDDHYHRSRNADREDNIISGHGVIYVPTDDYIITARLANDIVQDGNNFNIDAGWSLTFVPFGVEGKQGEQGRFDIAIYRNFANDAIPTAAPTGGTFTYATGRLTNVPTGWSINPSTPSSGERTVKAITTIDYANRAGTTLSVAWSAPIPETGEPGTGSGGSLTTDQTKLLARVGGFDIRDFRGGVPTPPFKTQTDDFALAKKTIGIGQDGVLWTLKDTPATGSTGTWIDFDNANYEFEQNRRLPVAALNAGDFWYRYDDDVWEVYDGTSYTVYYDREISTFLPNHIFLGQFANAENAVQSITNYDRTKTYLAYFTVTEDGQVGRQVRQLQSYSAGTGEVISWVSTDETLNHLSAELHRLIENNVNSIKQSRGLIDGHEKRIQAIDAEQTAQDTAIKENRDAIGKRLSGIQLITSASEKLITNLNGTSFGRTQADATDTPSFTDVNLLQNSEAGYENTHLSRFDRIRLIVNLLGASNVVLVSTEIDFSYAKWASLKALPRPEQNSYQDATIQDNRALVFNWMPDGIPAVFNAVSNGVAAATQRNVRAWLESFRNVDRTIFIGRTSQTNPRLTIAVRGYQGNVLGIDAIGYLGSSA